MAKKSLRLEIRRAKSAAWAELISTLNSDPWGLPYKLVMGTLRKSSPALSETLEESTLNRLLDSLFPSGTVDQTCPEVPTLAEEEESMDVGIADVIRVTRKRPSRDAAPGPDNLKASVWKKTPDVILDSLRISSHFALGRVLSRNPGRERCSC